MTTTPITPITALHPSVRPVRGWQPAVRCGRRALRGLFGRQPGKAGLAPLVVLDHPLGLARVPADEPVEVDVAVQVIGLVLQAAGEVTGALDFDRVALGV